MLTTVRRTGLLWPAAMTLVLLALLIGLGTWQLQRKAWKEALLADIAARTTQVPADIGDAIFATGAARVLPYTRVRLTGRFLHDKERFWFADGRLGSGFHVFTPLQLAGGGLVWINRGYIPAHLKDPATRAAGQIAGAVTVIGLVRAPGERNSFTPANDIAHNVWYWRDLAVLDASAFTPDVNSAPVMVDAEVEPANPGGWPEGGTAIVSLPNRHLEYALTWYGLAATLVGVFLVYARGRVAWRG